MLYVNVVVCAGRATGATRAREDGQCRGAARDGPAPCAVPGIAVLGTEALEPGTANILINTLNCVDSGLPFFNVISSKLLLLKLIDEQNSHTYVIKCLLQLITGRNR